MNKLLKDIALTFLAGLVVGFLNLKAGPVHASWADLQNILDDALRSGLLVPLAASLAPFYPAYGVGAANSEPQPQQPATPDYTKPSI